VEKKHFLSQSFNVSCQAEIQTIIRQMDKQTNE
jgi:hypothetical protein